MFTNAFILENDKEIVQEYVSKGTNRAATAFVRKYQQFVYNTAFRYLGTHDDAEDAAQEVFIKALNSLKKFKGNSSLKTWLYRITVNYCINIKRKKNVLTFFGIGGEEDFHNIPKEFNSPDKILEYQDIEERFLNALSELPEKQRETFSLRYFEEMSYEEISKLLGTSIGGLKANYYQAVKKLAYYLKEEKE